MFTHEILEKRNRRYFKRHEMRIIYGYENEESKHTSPSILANHGYNKTSVIIHVSMGV